MTSTVAANCNLLNLVDCNTIGQVFKGDDLCEWEKRIQHKALFYILGTTMIR